MSKETEKISEANEQLAQAAASFKSTMKANAVVNVEEPAMEMDGEKQSVHHSARDEKMTPSGSQ